MVKQCTVEGEASKLVIGVESYERATANDQSDANWLRCNVAGTFGAFSCSGSYSFTTTDMAQFLYSLEAALEGKAAKAYFSTMEEGLSMEIEINTRGQATVTGFVKSTRIPKVKLMFSFRSDQSYLQHTLADLREINQQFPERTASNS